MMPLTYAAPGEEHIILKVGGKPEVRQHLENLGFVPGGLVTVVTYAGRQSDCQCQGVPCGYQPGNGCQNNDLNADRKGEVA